MPDAGQKPLAFTQSAPAQEASRAVVQRADAHLPTSFTPRRASASRMTSSIAGDLFKGDIDTLPMDSLLDTVNVDAAPRRARTRAEAADVDEAKAAALRSAVAGSDVAVVAEGEAGGQARPPSPRSRRPTRRRASQSRCPIRSERNRLHHALCPCSVHAALHAGRARLCCVYTSCIRHSIAASACTRRCADR